MFVYVCSHCCCSLIMPRYTHEIIILAFRNTHQTEHPGDPRGLRQQIHVHTHTRTHTHSHVVKLHADCNAIATHRRPSAIEINVCLSTNNPGTRPDTCMLVRSLALIGCACAIRLSGWPRAAASGSGLASEPAGTQFYFRPRTGWPVDGCNPTLRSGA